MAEIKLAKLPDRTPVKLVIAIAPELRSALDQYAAAYEATYGTAETIAELIPYMLQSFLESDRAFAKFRTSNRAG